MNIRELSRLNAVREFQKFDFDLNGSLWGILKLASDICETPVAFITLIDEHDQWFKAKLGFDVLSMPRDTSFCTHAILQNDAMVVPDATVDERFMNNPLVKGSPNIRFYAGAPLTTNDGSNIGTLCVMDINTKQISPGKREHLEILAKQAMHLMELEVMSKLLNEKILEIERQNDVLTNIAFIQSHEFRAPVASIKGLMNIIKDEDYQSPKEYLILMEEAVLMLDEKIHVVVRSTEAPRRTG